MSAGHDVPGGMMAGKLPPSLAALSSTLKPPLLSSTSLPSLASSLHGNQSLLGNLPQLLPSHMQPGRFGDHQPLGGQDFMRRPHAGSDVNVHCTRDDKCVKENGHRGRCSLQRRPREDEMLDLLQQIRALQLEVAQVKQERDRLQSEVSTLWSKLAKACTFLTDIVRSKRSVNARSHTSPSAEECHRELKKITLACLQEEANEKHEQLRASLTLLESSMIGMQQPQECARRQAEIDAYKRQFEQDMLQMRMAHNVAAEQNAAEIVPYMVVSQTMIATEKILGRGK